MMKDGLERLLAEIRACRCCVDTPVGPPLAIRVTLTMPKPGAAQDADPLTYVHVIAIPAANGLGNPPAGSTNPSGMMSP